MKTKIKTFWRSSIPKKEKKVGVFKNTHLLQQKNIKSETEATELSGMLYKVNCHPEKHKITRITLKITLTFRSSLFHRIS